jgi:hypothetical protein
VLAQRVWTSNSSTINAPASVDAAICTEALANLTAHRTTLNTTMLGWLVTQRLGNMVTTGRIANRTAVVGGLQAFLAARYPELVAPVFTAPKGADALGDPKVRRRRRR